jgi:hypothetical protein
MSMSKKLAKCKERLSITENQSQASFKLRNQSIMGIGSSPQATKENLGGKRQNDSLHQNLQESSQAGYGTQCDELRSSQAYWQSTVRRRRTGLAKQSAMSQGRRRLSIRYSATISVNLENLEERQKIQRNF